MKGGAVAKDGRIEPGDMILQVNDINFENMSNDEAVRKFLNKSLPKNCFQFIMQVGVIIFVGESSQRCCTKAWTNKISSCQIMGK